MGASSSRFYGWTVVLAAFVIAVFGWGVGFYGPPIYLEAVRSARGWSVALVSAAVTAHFLVGAGVVANLARLHRRFGLARITSAGALSLALGVAGWAFAAQPWQIFAATLLSGAGWAALGGAGINAMVSPWFNRRRPAALSTAYNGASVGGVIFSPLWVGLIAWCGFPAASILVGSLMAICVLGLAAHVLRRTPEAMGLHPDGDVSVPGARAPATSPPRGIVRSPWRDRAFQTLALGMALGLFAQIGLIAHLFSLLVAALGVSAAGIVAGLSTASAIAGRALVGWLMPANADRRVVGTLNYAVQICGCGAFLLAGGSNVPLLLTGVLLFGLGIGNATSMPPLIAQAEFAPRDVGRVVALATALAQASYAFAPVAFGMIRDATGMAGGAAAPALFAAAAGFQLLAALAYWCGRGAWTRSREGGAEETSRPMISPAAAGRHGAD